MFLSALERVKPKSRPEEASETKMNGAHGSHRTSRIGGNNATPSCLVEFVEKAFSASKIDTQGIGWRLVNKGVDDVDEEDLNGSTSAAVELTHLL